MGNPFSVKTPESLSSNDIVDLFVDVYNDFSSIQDAGHTFVHGARGTGKSMMLRYLEPQVQLIAGKADCLENLPFLAVHVPIKVAVLNLPEMDRLHGLAYSSMAEHMLLMHISSRIFSTLSNLDSLAEEELTRIRDALLELLTEAGSSADISLVNNCLGFVSLFDAEFRKCIQYIRRLAFSSEPVGYDGALCGFSDFLIPLVKRLRSLKSFPTGPVFIMLDDADNLSLEMQQIINSWVACRTTKDLCLKISTQMRYRTWRTTSGQLIEAPHDYSEVNINTIYTSDIENYRSRVESIVRKRLTVAGIGSTPYDFFPVNTDQEEAIALIGKELSARWNQGEGRGHRASDDVVRYARPNYMKQLYDARSSATYSYAGFKNLVDLSSGIVRWFLEPAARMYNEAVSSDEPLDHIGVGTQDKVIRSWSEDFLLSEFEKLRDDESTQDSNFEASNSEVDKLYTLICSLGALFRERLLDDSLSERRIFSIMIKPSVPPDIRSVLRLGIEWGYFHESTIGSKEGLGRNRLIILSRRLAAYFKLDPSGYAGYVQVTEDDLRLACDNTAAFLRSRGKTKINDNQLALDME